MTSGSAAAAGMGRMVGSSWRRKVGSSIGFAGFMVLIYIYIILMERWWCFLTDESWCLRNKKWIYVYIQKKMNKKTRSVDPYNDVFDWRLITTDNDWWCWWRAKESTFNIQIILLRSSASAKVAAVGGNTWAFHALKVWLVWKTCRPTTKTSKIS